MEQHLLSLTIFLPLLGALVLIVAFRSPTTRAPSVEHVSAAKPGGVTAIRWFTLAVTAGTFALSLALLMGFDVGLPGYQFAFTTEWMPQWKVFYSVGLDGMSLLLVVLTTLLSLLSAIYSFSVTVRVKEYMVFLLVLETAMLGVFGALDLVLFYVFWEMVLVPMYFLIGIWGHERRIYAAIKFFVYTFAGSVLMLVAIAFVYAHTGSFSLVDLSYPAGEIGGKLHAVGPRALMFLYGAFALAFMIKVPMFPFHTWLPDAHVEAPTAGSVILAGVMLKMGVYGFLRICLPMFPAQAHASAGLFITLSIVGIVYGAVVAAVQPDMKKLVAYSSVSHLGFVMLGVFSFTTLGLTGAILQSINHGVSTGMLFFLVGMLYERRHTREISAFGGLKRSVPVLAAFFLVAMLSSVALPLTNGFVGEFAILQGSFISQTAGFWPTAVASSGIVLSAVYMLWLFQRVFAGPLTSDENRTCPDLSVREKLVLVPLVILVFWFGCYVSTWTRFLRLPVESAEASVANRHVRRGPPPAPPMEYIEAGP